MAEQTVAVYQWDANKHFSGIRIKGVDEPLQENETLVKPKDGLYTPITWNGSDWIGTSRETWEANQPKVEVKPTQQGEAMNALGLQLAQVMKTQEQTSKAINALGLQVAQLSKGGNN